MSDQYLMKVGIDLDQTQFDKLAGKITSSFSSMGKLSNDFIDTSLKTAKEYNKEIATLEKKIQSIDAAFKKGGLDSDTQIRLKQLQIGFAQRRKDLIDGNAKKGIQSKREVDAMADFAKKAQSSGQKMSAAFGKLNKGIGVASLVINFAKDAIKSGVKQFTDAMNSLAEGANKLNAMGAFGNQQQRNLMTRYGMSSTQAMGFSNTLSAMGMSESDIGRMTPEQRKVFNSLNNFWNEGMGKLDPEKLERYTKTMSEYQEMTAKFTMGFQMTVFKLLSESDGFNKMIGKVGDLLDTTLDFLGSPIVQNVFDGLISFLTTCITILEKGLKIVNKLDPRNWFGGGSDVGSVKSSNTSNYTYNMYGSDYHTNDELARQISYSSNGGYKG